MAIDFAAEPLPTAEDHRQRDLERLTLAALALLAVLGQRRLDGSGGSDEVWLAAVQALLLREHLAAALIAAQPWGGLDRATLALVQQRVQEQFGFLQAFVAARPVEAWGPRDLARLAQYGDGAVRGTFSAVTRNIAAQRGLTQERNVLGGAEHHCSECPALTAQGWVPIGTLPEVGSRQCLGNDHCTIRVR